VSKTFDRYAGFVFLLIGIGFMVESRNISDSSYGSNVGPNIFPLGLGLILSILSLRLFYETLRYPEKDPQKPILDYKRFLIILAAAILYGFFLEEIGYVIGTFLFLFIGFQTMEKGKWGKSVLISGMFSFGVYYLFVEILQGSLPGFPVWLGF
jgi:putative tricarboxylic transport membrane protein